MSNLKYIGEELEIFAYARNWKQYFSSIISPYFGKNILEVGAGIGTTTAVLYHPRYHSWTCLEPDNNLKQILDRKIKAGVLPSACQTRLGIIHALDQDELFDTILYIDVLEHIAKDHEEIQAAVNHLNFDGTMIVLSPAHQWLCTPFDQAIGHYRRYTRASLGAIKPDGCSLESLLYLDSVGMLLSLGNRLLLKQSMPTAEQIKFWDKWFVPISQVFDSVLGFRIGKTIVAIWRKQ
jgi:hypothetical protein